MGKDVSGSDVVVVRRVEEERGKGVSAVRAGTKRGNALVRRPHVALDFA